MASAIDVQFEHYHDPNTLGVHHSTPRISWKIKDPTGSFKQASYEIEVSDGKVNRKQHLALNARRASSLVPWPFNHSLRSRQKISIRVRLYDDKDNSTPWSEPAYLEIGLLVRQDWQCQRIAAPWGPGTSEPDPEQLYRKEFHLSGEVEQARLYITAQGVYEAEVNGQRVGDYFLAPGWTAYDNRLQYQTYDLTTALVKGSNCIGVRLAEGWFSGRIGFEGGHRNIWGPHTALLAQLEILYTDGHSETIVSDGSWTVTKGPIKLAEIYDGEKYDARDEITSWSTPAMDKGPSKWESVLVMEDLPLEIELTAGYGEPIRRVEVIKPIEKIITPSGKTILDFGQNLVGYLRLRSIKGPRGHKITLRHAEVLETGELGTRPLRICKATDEYTLKGDENGETYEPRFTFHGFRYAEIDGWLGELDLASVEAVICHTDMKPVGEFECSEPLLNQLYKNVVWGMRGNFLSVPTDCPQRDERLGWSGDLALFAPTATLLYDCFGMLKNWLIDLEHDQNVLGGVPPMETGDESLLAQQYKSMTTWMKVLPRKDNLWDPKPFQLGDWLDPAAPPDAPWKGATDAKMVANMFLIQSLDLMVKISAILGYHDESAKFQTESEAARGAFQDEYVTRNGRLVSDSQAAYALAICLNVLSPTQKKHAADRLAWLVRKNNFKIGTGFAGTPYLCEALASTGHFQVAYAALLEKGCPSWLYPVTMGATTMWERWDSMLPDGSINPGEMTSFNHYAFGAIAKFLYERLAGLQRLEPGWKRCRIAPGIGAEFTSASASHITPHGKISCSWETCPVQELYQSETIKIRVTVPPNITAEVIIPGKNGERIEVVGAGEWEFESVFDRDNSWPVLPLPPKS
ncbi:hypothetical protein N0V84_008129 [Fusarium piperis]|uniref:alpha-L-rhamnosidase n=1 Tax=Fusarium piperis TaxID=1435070 RepID=A0A9W8W8T7_9HYPO|nr:hypothetical protein N0V84_008129 [Fusarium piperis]